VPNGDAKWVYGELTRRLETKIRPFLVTAEAVRECDRVSKELLPRLWKAYLEASQ